jgi:two-component system, LytTR family, response regulator
VRIALADDEPAALAKLVRFLDGVPDVTLVGTAGNGDEALALGQAHALDAMILDITMPGRSGLEVAAALPESVLVVFSTAHDDFAVRAFELAAVDYLLKPFTRARFLACLERLRGRLPAEARSGVGLALQALQPADGHWVIVSRGAIERVPLADVECVEAADNYIELHGAARTWLDRTPLAAFLAHPATADFVRVHRRFAVHRTAITRVTPVGKGDAELLLRSGRTVRVSRRYRGQALPPEAP